MSKRLIIPFLLLAAWNATCQVVDDFYDAGTIQEIRISFKESNWQQILDSLFVNYGDTCRLVGEVTVNGQLFRGAGVRYKGYSSWNENTVKNPFNIDLDYTFESQSYKGHSKIKLSNVIHDPSFVREVLSYEIARMYFPASRANYARLIVNDALIGLYTNVEAVDKKFANLNFGTSDGSFFKGEPDTLVYPFGENSNLAYSHGTDTNGYKPFYKMESDSGWTDLLNLIRILNTHTDSLGGILNIDRTLWMHAFNYALLNLDSYIGYCQNYYLYRDQNGLFNPIVWDLNMSFASFRETDGSYNFLGVSIPKIKILDPLGHLKFSVSPRPLMTKLFQNDTLSRMYLAHLRTIVKENFINQSAYNRAKELQQQIDTFVQEDTNKFYPYESFLQNIDTTVKNTGGFMFYPGLRDIITARSAYLSMYPGFAGEPVISSINHSPGIPKTGKNVWVTVKADNASQVFLFYRFSSSSVFSSIAMHDDGLSEDGLAGDSVFGAAIVPDGKIIQYYFYAENDLAGVFAPEKAASEFYLLQPEPAQGDLVINEIRAGNSDSWIELFNNTKEDIDLSGLSLASADASTSTFTFQSMTINAGDFLVIDADDIEFNNPGLVLLASEPSNLILKSRLGNILDEVSMGWQVDQKTIGRYPNGYGPIIYMQPTPGNYNSVGTTPSEGFHLYPNPVNEKVTLEFRNPGDSYSLRIINMSGQEIYRYEGLVDDNSPENIAIPVDLSHYCGLFLVILNSNGTSTQRKLIVN